MNIDTLTDVMIQLEGLRLKPYRDTTGKLTIGIGRNLDDVGISKAEAQLLFMSDVNVVLSGLDAKVPWWRTMCEARQVAFFSMWFNMGLGELDHWPKLVAALRAGDWLKAAAEVKDSKLNAQLPARSAWLQEVFLKGTL